MRNLVHVLGIRPTGYRYYERLHVMSSSEAILELRESVWLDQGKYEQAEGRYQEVLAGRQAGSAVEGRSVAVGKSGLSDSIGATMSIIQQSLAANTQSGRHADLGQRVSALERENQQLKKDLQELVGRVAGLEARLGGSTAAPTSASTATAGGEEDEDFDLFGSDGEEEEEEVVKAEQEKEKRPQPKAKKPGLVAKSTIVLEVKPWDIETDMAEMERLVRSITTEGLLWGAAKLVPVAYGIMKLQISCVVEDEKVGTDFLEESITAFEDHVQSVDIVAFNKI